MSGSSPGAQVPAATSRRQPGGDVHAASTETGERLAAGRYAHWRSKQTQVPSGGMLLSHAVGAGAEAAATQRFGRHGSSHAQSVSFAHEAAPDPPSLDGAAGVAPGSVAPGSGLATGLPGVAAASVGVVAVAVAAGGVDVGELLHATMVRLARVVRLARNAARFTAEEPGGRESGAELDPRPRPQEGREPNAGAPPAAEGWLLIGWRSCRDELAPVRRTG
jgi:hypothetical protein